MSSVTKPHLSSSAPSSASSALLSASLWSCCLGLLSVCLLSSCDLNKKKEPEPPPTTAKFGSIEGFVRGAQIASATHENIIRDAFLVKRKAGLSAQQLSTLTVHISALNVGDVHLEFDSNLGMNNIALYKITPKSLQALQAQMLRAPASSKSSTRFSQQLSQQIVEQLTAHPQIEAAEADRMVFAQNTPITPFTPNDPFFSKQWNLQAANIPKAWALIKKQRNEGKTAKTVKVAVVDSGSIDHPDLKDHFLAGLDVIANPVNSGDGDGIDRDPTDEGTSFHGAHVMGILAATINNNLGIAGVSDAVKIVPVRVLGHNGKGSNADVLKGIVWATGGRPDNFPKNDNPVQVINLSLGGQASCGPIQRELFTSLANDKGVIFVVAAGNLGIDVSEYLPANCPKTITVGATGPDGKRAYYSNYGSDIDVMAPGGNKKINLTFDDEEVPARILSTVASKTDRHKYTYSWIQGTSMAAPHVTGVVSMMKSLTPSLTYDQALDRLKQSSKPLSDEDCGVVAGCGAGSLDAFAALQTTSSIPTPTPKPPTPKPPTLVNRDIFVAALYRLPSGQFDTARSASVLIPPKTNFEPYTFPKLQLGTYQIVAWQDLNGDQRINADEPFGVYTNTADRTDIIRLVEHGQRIKNINIHMNTTDLRHSVLMSSAQQLMQQHTFRRLQTPTQTPAQTPTLGHQK